MANNMQMPCFPIETSSTVDPTSGCDDNEGLCRLPYYTKLTWVPFNVRFINVDLINVFFCQNCILVYIN